VLSLGTFEPANAASIQFTSSVCVLLAALSHFPAAHYPHVHPRIIFLACVDKVDSGWHGPAVSKDGATDIPPLSFLEWYLLICAAGSHVAKLPTNIALP